MLTLMRKVINFCSSVFLAVMGEGSTRIFDRFFSFFVFTEHRQKRLLSPIFFISNNLQHLIIGINSLDLKHEKHGSGHWLFCCSAPCSAVATFKGVYGGFLRKKEQIPMALGTRYAMCIWKNSCSKGSTLYTHLKKWIFGPENKVIVEKQEDIF